MTELELISNSSLTKIKFLIFNEYEIFIIIIFKDFFRSSAVGFSRGKVFLVSKKDYFAMKNTCITEST